MFKKAERKRTYLKIGLQGPAGSGKSYSALLIAKGFGGKIAVIDTENGSASLYSKQFDFDSAEMSPPFLTEKYIKAIKAAVDAKYDVLIIDSLSHAWAGEGGLLAQKEAIDSRGKGNSYTNWASITKKHNEFMQEILQAPIHIISTLRTKTEYVLQEVNGKQVPKKIGMASIQREGVDYEMTTILELAHDNSYEATKDRTGLFTGRIDRVTENTGKMFKEWLES